MNVLYTAVTAAFTSSSVLGKDSAEIYAKNGRQELADKELAEIKVLEKYFGDNHPYIHEDIQCFLGDGVLYRYDSAKREYFFQDIHGHGGAGIYPAEIYYLDGQKKDEVYTVRVNVLYGDYCYGTCGPVTGYYKSAIDSRNGENPVLGGFGDYYEITEKEYQSVKDNLPVTTFTFIRDKDGNYGLESVTVE